MYQLIKTNSNCDRDSISSGADIGSGDFRSDSSIMM